MSDKNYNSEQELKLRDVYDPSASQSDRDQMVTDLANDFGKKKRSIIAKLSRMDLYVAKVRTTKTGQPVEHKSDIVADIAQAVGVSSESIASLAKATKSSLQALSCALAVDATN